MYYTFTYFRREDCVLGALHLTNVFELTVDSLVWTATFHKTDSFVKSCSPSDVCIRWY